MTPFLWGVATSAYQAEGGYNGPGEPLTNWRLAEKRGDVAMVGQSADFWNRFEEDFARCQRMGLNAFRMGIEWSRVQPLRVPSGEPVPRVVQPVTGTAERPPFDFAALDHYARMLTSARAHGLEPVVTWHHFIHPAW